MCKYKTLGYTGLLSLHIERPSYFSIFWFLLQPFHIIVSPGVTHSVTLHSCDECSVMEWVTPGLTRMWHSRQGHQSSSLITYTSWIKLSISLFCEHNLENGQSYLMRHSLNFSTVTLISVLRRYSAWPFKMVFNEEKLLFFNFKTDSRISLFANAHYSRYVEGGHQGHGIAFSDF